MMIVLCDDCGINPAIYEYHIPKKDNGDIIIDIVNVCEDCSHKEKYHNPNYFYDNLRDRIGS